MSPSPQHAFGATDLDPELLSTPFKIQTNWHVITGGACCGKTTLIDLLADHGYQTVAEVARQHIDREMAKGRTLEEIFGSKADQRAIKAWQRQIEHGLRATNVIFLDRAMPDCLYFWRLHGLDPNEMLAECFHHHYASVFILDPLPLELDGARIEDEAFTVRFDEALVADYGALGYCVVRVPVLSPQQRVEFVLQTLSDRGLL